MNLNDTLTFLKPIFKNNSLSFIFLNVILLILLLLPFIENNILYNKRIENQIDIITKFDAIDEQNLNETLSSEYKLLLDDYSNHIYDEPIIRKTSCNYKIILFISTLTIIFSIGFVLIKKQTQNKVFSFIICLITSLVYASVAIYIPIIFNFFITFFIVIILMSFIALFLNLITKIDTQ